MRILFVALCTFTMGISAHAQSKHTIKKTVTTTTEITNENGKKTVKTEKVESFDNDGEVEEHKEQLANSELHEVSDPSGLPTKNEDWYFLAGIGPSHANYSGVLGNAYEEDGDASGVDRTSTINFELAVYWPLSDHKTMLGVASYAVGDSMEDSAGNEQSLYVNLLGFSAYHFFGKNIGDAWFIRGDVGLTAARIDIDYNSANYDGRSDRELGFMFGGGYGFPLGSETRVLVGLYLMPLPTLAFDSGNSVKGFVTNLTAGFLF